MYFANTINEYRGKDRILLKDYLKKDSPNKYKLKIRRKYNDFFNNNIATTTNTYILNN